MPKYKYVEKFLWATKSDIINSKSLVYKRNKLSVWPIKYIENEYLMSLCTVKKDRCQYWLIRLQDSAQVIIDIKMDIFCSFESNSSTN